MTKPPLPDAFTGRAHEIKLLRDLGKRRQKAALVTCSGRRRIGKSRLIQEFATRHAEHFLEFQGLPPRGGQTNRDQLHHFAERLALHLRLDQPVPLTNWTQAFQLLDQLIPRRGRTVILLDEVSWMGRHEPDFAGKIKEAWDTRFQHHPNLILVLCGSVPTWIEENIIRHTGFLDRISLRIRLEELSLAEANAMVWGRATKVSDLEKLRILAVTGAVPRYLEEIDAQSSAEENVRRLCFQPEGALFRPGGETGEFDAIFIDIFERRAKTYREIAETLADGSKTLSQLTDAMDKTRAGAFSHYLRALELAGFLREEPSFTVGREDGKISHFRISDNYLRFHLKILSRHHLQIARGRYRWTSLDTLLAWDTLLGLQFENLVLNNASLVAERLGLRDNVLRGGPYRQSATKRRRGCQIDLLLETPHSLFLGEIKLRRRIGPEVIGEVRDKLERLSLPRAARRLNRFPFLVHAGELDPAVARAGFFHTIIPFADLLRLS